MSKEESKHQLSLQEKNARISRLIAQARIELGTAQRQYEQAMDTEFGNEYLKTHMLEQATALIKSMQENLQRLESILTEMRLPGKSEIEYRNKLLKEFSARLSDLSGKYPDLRFHGTGYIDAFSVIEYGGVVSSQERGLVRSSFDGSGQISVTTPESVSLSVRDYIEIKDLLLPLGCLFVVLPEDEMDAQAGKSYLMKSIKFKENDSISDRFVCVLTSEEALPKVKKALKEAAYPEEKAFEFFDFLNHLEKS